MYFRSPVKTVSITPPSPTVTMATKSTSATGLPSVLTKTNLGTLDRILTRNTWEIF
ncbi:hypothetical protein PMIN01_02843 [Paraphaeosphaeria minitans]|uniref:Uncharacterized protein n=1 Tax=Paraphaeosphaeria minitans TaxID=565426 RepID=A0A9P6GRI1_9PLEO|nr:hypothetical protein PMIN01_02843 [Paraphaeosphaeria minitans]